MDFQTLDETQYLYNNEQLSQEEYKNKTRKAFKKLMFTTALLDSFLNNEYFDQEVEDFYENNNLL